MESGNHDATRCHETTKRPRTDENRPNKDFWIVVDDDSEQTIVSEQQHVDLKSQRRANRSHQVGTGCEDNEISSLEAEILDAVCLSWEQPEDNEDTEAMKSWWREKALKSLEGDVNQANGQAGNHADESNGEDETEEEARARWQSNIARALEALEGRNHGHGKSEQAGNAK